MSEQTDHPYSQLICPHCKASVVDVVDDSATVQPCVHLAFAFIGMMSDFEFQSPAFAQRAQSLDHFDFVSDPEQCLKELGYGSEMVIESVQQENYGHFRRTLTDYFGFDALQK